MSLREEQCRKVCRILDDVLANRPTERDSLIVATRSAFRALSEPHWIPVTERLPENRGTYLVTAEGFPVTTKFFSAEYDGWGSEWRKAITAWMPLPEPYKGVTT